MFSVKQFQGFLRRSGDGYGEMLQQLPAQYAQRGSYAVGDVSGRAIDAVIASPSRFRDALAVAAPAVLADVAGTAAEAAHCTVSFVHLRTIDLLGAIASVGVEVPPSTFEHARAILAAILTRRQDEYPAYHFMRGFMAIGLDEPRVYRGIIAHAGEPSLPFTAGETFGPNMQGLLTHLAGAVEHGAPPEAVLPAFHDLLGDYIHLQEAKLVGSGALFWFGFVLHHRLGRRPLATFADWLHATLYRAAGEEP
ncbi:MAG: hypothetical protein IPF99_32265 [Deltaproteobacteria bacterium]|nr:hypothetical protein [Deltaproteobacteria bacterium]MBK7065878.1 hypothetical protein [Deltaproteobacteria bacterium]